MSVNKGKRKYGDDSEDSDEDLTYEQYMEEVQVGENAKKTEKNWKNGYFWQILSIFRLKIVENVA